MEVGSIRRYKLEVRYAEESKREVVEQTSSAELEDTNGIAKYYDEGTEIELRIEIKDSKEEGKYTIEIKENGETIQSGETIDLNKASGNAITLNANRMLVVGIQEKAYAVVVEKESVYTTLEELESLSPTKVEQENWINEMVVEGNSYRNKAIISIKNAQVENGEVKKLLYRIILRGNETEETVYTITNGKVDEIVQNGYAIRITNERVEISYETQSEVHLQLEYIEVKEISQ